MKKGLSVLLIAAALFGFYGGATSLTDILASKDYWEEQGEKSTADMNKLEDGLNQLKDNEQAYVDGKKTYEEGLKTLADGEAQYEQGLADYAAAPAKLRAGEAALASGEKDYAAGEKKLATAKSLLAQLRAGVAELNDPDEGYAIWRQGIIDASKNPATAAFRKGGTMDGDLDGKVIAETKSNLEKLQSALSEAFATDAAMAKLENTTSDIPKDKLPKALLAKLPEETPDPVPAATIKYVAGQIRIGIWNGDGTAKNPGVKNIVKAQAPTIPVDSMSNASDLAAYLETSIYSCTQLLKLTDGKAKMQDKLIPLLEKVKGNQQVENQIGSVDKLILGLTGSDMTFMRTMDGIMAAAPGLIAMVAREVNKGENDLRAGAAKLAAGRRELAQGYADYAAAPGKLADAEKQLADGKKQLADGKKQLDQYEDGEQQVRDGLATLMATKADPGLESILDRSNGDDKFDDANGHLQLDKGLAAVDTGRGYQADSGELITKEITNRAVGTAAGLGAAALAVLAAILSFLKKSKGAAVSAVLAAVAGGIGAGVGLSAGEYYSDIAGSTIGNTPFIAAAVLAAVAAVFAIVHFTAKPEAK